MAAVQTNLNNVQGSQGLQLTNLAEVKDLCTGMVEAGEAPPPGPGMPTQCSVHRTHADCVPLPLQTGSCAASRGSPAAERLHCAPANQAAACAAGAPLSSLAAQAPSGSQPACQPGVKLTFILQ